MDFLTTLLWLQVAQLGGPDAAAAGAAAAQSGPAGAAATTAASAAASTAASAPASAGSLEAAAAASPWTEYILYGAILAMLVAFLVKALRAKPPVSTAPEGPPVEAPRTAAEVRAAARADFPVNQVVPEAQTEPGVLRVRRAHPDDAPPPTRDPVRGGKTSAGSAPGGKAPAGKASAGQTPTGKAPAGKAPTPAAKPQAPAAKPPAPAPVEAAGKTLREGLARTHDGFIKRLGAVFGSAKTIDDDLLGNLEEILFTADIGVRTSQRLVEEVHAGLSKKALKDPANVFAHLRQTITDILVAESPPLDLGRASPLVVMVVGVNGAGKTTTIGKLARRFQDEGRKVLLAAADTFRAAAVEQLQVWGERAGVDVVRGAEGQDPSSVVFEAIERARREGYDVCIADTAGRLQAKKELMDELAKVHRVAGKALAGAPHEVWLVLDATNGQNAISQARLFTEAVAVTGIVLTKLDGTAKGGVVIGISDEMKIPVRFIGIGEKVEDLRPFEPRAFAAALFGDT